MNEQEAISAARQWARLNRYVLPSKCPFAKLVSDTDRLVPFFSHPTDLRGWWVVYFGESDVLDGNGAVLLVEDATGNVEWPKENPATDWNKFRRMRRFYHLSIAVCVTGSGLGLIAAILHAPAVMAVAVIVTLIICTPLMLPSIHYLKAWPCPRCGLKFCGAWHDDAGATGCRNCGLPMYESDSAAAAR